MAADKTEAAITFESHFLILSTPLPKFCPGVIKGTFTAAEVSDKSFFVSDMYEQSVKKIHFKSDNKFCDIASETRYFVHSVTVPSQGGCTSS